MRRIGLILSSLVAAGFIAARADATPSKLEQPKKVQLELPKKAARIFTPAQATKQGKVDDRLIRPHRTFDASAGFLG